MPHDLVEDVRLRRVERLRRVPQVLRRVEHAVRERPVEDVERHEPRGRVEPEAAERIEARADLVELRDAVGGQREGLLALQVAADREPLVLRRELAAHGLPDRVLGVGVVHLRHRVAGLPREGGGGDLVPAAAVRVVVRARVVVREVHGGLAVLVGGDGGVELSFFEHAIRSTPEARATHPPDGVLRRRGGAAGLGIVPSMGRRAWTAWRARPVGRRDAWGAGVLVLVAAGLLARRGADLDPVVAAFVLLGTASLAWRRTAPLVALTVSGVALCATTAVSGPGSGALGPALVAVYSAVAWDRRLAGTVAAAVDIAAVAVLDRLRTGDWWADDVTLSSALLAVVLAAGFAVGSRRTTLEDARDRVERAERTREAEAARQVAEERLRIARELHDVLGHHVAVIGVQAGVAETLLVTRPEARALRSSTCRTRARAC